jgi:hypothetical protein
MSLHVWRGGPGFEKVLKGIVFPEEENPGLPALR